MQLCDIRILARVHYDSVDFDILTADRHKSVRFGTVIVNRVTLVQDFFVSADVRFQGTLDNDIKLLSGMSGHFHGVVLFIRNFYPKRFGNLVFEHRCQVFVDIACQTCNRQTAALSCKIVA